MGFEEIVFVTGIVFLAYFTRGFSGFGAAIVAAPLLVLFLPMQTMVLLLAMLGIPANVLMVWLTWQHVAWGEALLISAGMAVSTFLGMQVLFTLDDRLLKQIFAVAMVLLALLSLWRPAEASTRRRNPALEFAAGALGGLTGALFAINGPPVVLYLTYTMDDKDRFRGTLSVIFLLGALWKGVVFLGRGLLTLQSVWVSLALWPVLALALFLGGRLSGRVNMERFRQIVVGLLVLNAALLLLKTWVT